MVVIVFFDSNIEMICVISELGKKSAS